jgi:hypothetical protein
MEGRAKKLTSGGVLRQVNATSRNLRSASLKLEASSATPASVVGLIGDDIFARFEEVRVESFVYLGEKRWRLESGMPKDELRGRSCVGEFGRKLRVLVGVGSWELGRVCGSRRLAWEMKSVAVEEKREGRDFGGVFIARRNRFQFKPRGLG